MVGGISLREQRMQLGVSGVELARALGVSASAVSRIESRTRLRPTTVRRYNLALEQCAVRQQAKALALLGIRARSLVDGLNELVSNQPR
jgi:transcriptional regulator with XRE-family HTH domain